MGGMADTCRKLVDEFFPRIWKTLEEESVSVQGGTDGACMCGSAHDCGGVVDGSNAMVALLVVNQGGKSGLPKIEGV